MEAESPPGSKLVVMLGGYKGCWLVSWFLFGVWTDCVRNWNEVEKTRRGILLLTRKIIVSRVGHPNHL